jgi:4-diphosphocytidyl-2-C-methyl-D-erythritol kinase
MLHAIAPAKVNLTLAVGPRAADGFHPLRSVFIGLGLADELTIDFAPVDAAGDQLTIAGDLDCPVQGNLVLSAFQLLRGVVGRPLPPLSAQLLKRIPLGAGLGGGSADGAAALELAPRAWGVGLAPPVRRELEEALGSDVPFFARGLPAALVEGRGERVTPLAPLRQPVGVLLAASPAQLSTPAVYARFDELDRPDPTAEQATDELVGLLSGGADGAVLASLADRLAAANDLWPAAATLMPALVERRSLLERLSGRPWLMTGSGPTLLALYPSAEQAASARDRLARESSVIESALALIATQGGARRTQEESQ